MIKYIILTGSKYEYDFYAKKYNFNTMELRYATKFEDIAGLHNIPVIRLGRYIDNPLNNKIGNKLL